MQQSKLLDVLRHFSGRQLTRFRDFLDSPYFNNSAELLQFFDFLAKHAPDFRNPVLEKATVLRTFKSAKLLNAKRLAYLMNQLQQLAEAFLATEHFRADDLEEAMALLQVFDPDALPRHYKFALEKAVQALEKKPLRNAAYFLSTFRLKAIRYDHADLQQHQFYQTLQEASDALDDFYLVEKLRYGWAMAASEYVLNVRYQWNLGDRVLDYLLQNELPLNPTAQIYLAGIRLVREPENTAHFFHLKNLLEQHENRFSEPEQKQLYTGLLNYCTRRINRENDLEFSTEYLEINKKLLASGLLFENGELSPWRFINLVNTGLRNGQTTWVSDFIRQYRKHLPEVYADDVTRIVRGQYHYHLGEYGQAQVLLNQVNPPNVLLAVTIRNLLARIYYETGETELLLAHLEAYRIYLLRQELLSQPMKQQARRFVDFTRKLAKIDKPEAGQLPKLKKAMPATAEIYHRDWLLEQIQRKMEAFGLGTT
ncbi:MAG: hypothetical protein IPM36_00290 [Lewinellaceae bacterium]|nr:hypothetical protein [Lewinellaceae bacterium]